MSGSEAMRNYYEQVHDASFDQLGKVFGNVLYLILASLTAGFLLALAVFLAYRSFGYIWRFLKATCVFLCSIPLLLILDTEPTQAENEAIELQALHNIQTESTRRFYRNQQQGFCRITGRWRANSSNREVLNLPGVDTTGVPGRIIGMGPPPKRAVKDPKEAATGDDPEIKALLNDSIPDSPSKDIQSDDSEKETYQQPIRYRAGENGGVVGFPDPGSSTSEVPMPLKSSVENV